MYACSDFDGRNSYTHNICSSFGNWWRHSSLSLIRRSVWNGINISNRLERSAHEILLLFCIIFPSSSATEELSTRLGWLTDWLSKCEFGCLLHRRARRSELMRTNFPIVKQTLKAFWLLFFRFVFRRQTVVREILLHSIRTSPRVTAVCLCACVFMCRYLFKRYSSPGFFSFSFFIITSSSTLFSSRWGWRWRKCGQIDVESNFKFTE